MCVREIVREEKEREREGLGLSLSIEKPLIASVLLHK